MDQFYAARIAVFLKQGESVAPLPSQKNKTRRAKHLAKTGAHCWYCGIELKGNHWVIEHQNGHTPRGKTKSETLVPACYPCNGRKGKMNLEEYRRYMNVERFYGEAQ